MKYIRHAEFGIFLFPDKGDSGLAHVQLAERISSPADIISAGFVKFDKTGEPFCSGFSGSLLMGPIETDNAELKKLFKNAGFTR